MDVLIQDGGSQKKASTFSDMVFRDEAMKAAEESGSPSPYLLAFGPMSQMEALETLKMSEPRHWNHFMPLQMAESQ